MKNFEIQLYHFDYINKIPIKIKIGLKWVFSNPKVDLEPLEMNTISETKFEIKE